ncbi:rac GTPase-activating protein 1-like [Notothenia coriiceps]|uniref:Rac GTPase-activating protein 1-like n=1 Tax=Notothenia coriiceps TaxID=8208 RepID=A0A6I9NA72_9TELE|nr:PREDICTED: rac GTPase-activating protein 1-like [Notothenia coriiceps]
MELGNTQRTQRNPLQLPLTQQTNPQEIFVPPERDQTSVWLPANKTLLEPEPESKMEESAAVRALYQKPLERTLKHEFLSKTVIMPETCSLCGKRIRFGRMALKCRTCRAVAHPECKMRFSSDCSTIPPQGGGATQKLFGGLLPGCPPLGCPTWMVGCVAEIDEEEAAGGGERLVKELRMMVLQGKTPPWGRWQDVHVLCGFLKDFP